MKTALAVLTLLIPVVGNADTLPLEDGAYLRNVQSCHLYKANDLDFIDFEVAKNDREFGLIYVGCLVHSVKKVRSSRYHVEADCIEGGEPYQLSNFIDILDDMSIRIDGGEKHYSCNVYLAKHKPLKNAEKLLRSITCTKETAEGFTRSRCNRNCLRPTRSYWTYFERRQLVLR